VLNILFDVFIASLDYKTVKMSLLGAYCLVGANLFTNLNIFLTGLKTVMVGYQHIKCSDHNLSYLLLLGALFIERTSFQNG
jgi:hypothetical protein